MTLGGFYTINFNYANFTRAGPGHDDLIKLDGYNIPDNSCTKPGFESDPACKFKRSEYDPNTDMIRTGQRVDINPSWYLPIKLGSYVDATPRVSYRESWYYFNVGDERTNTRRYLRTDLNLLTQVSSVYDRPFFFPGYQVKHEVVPEIRYTGTPWVDHKSHQFFGFDFQSRAPIYSREPIKDLDLQNNSNLQFDYYDRIYDRSLVTFALANRLIQKRHREGKLEYKQVASLAMAQSYDASGTSPYPWSDLSTVVDLRFDRVETYATFNYFPQQNVTSVSNRFKLRNAEGNFLELLWYRQYQIKIGEPEAGRPTQDYGFNIGLISPTTDLVGQVMFDGDWENSASRNRIKSWGLISQLKPPGECWLIGLTMSKNVQGSFSMKLSFEFSFDGTAKPPPDPDAIKDIYQLGI